MLIFCNKSNAFPDAFRLTESGVQVELDVGCGNKLQIFNSI